MNRCQPGAVLLIGSRIETARPQSASADQLLTDSGLIGDGQGSRRSAGTAPLAAPALTNCTRSSANGGRIRWEDRPGWCGR